MEERLTSITGWQANPAAAGRPWHVAEPLTLALGEGQKTQAAACRGLPSTPSSFSIHYSIFIISFAVKASAPSHPSP